MTDNKKTRGRQRIDTSKRRESEEDRLITFSKRRVGLYKKASELCTLCGTELAILIFSPSGKPFSFAHPNIEVIARRFLKLEPQSNDKTNDIMDACLQNRINELNERLTQLSIEVEAEKERGRKLAQMDRTPQNKPLCNQNINELGDDDAQRLKAWLLELQVRINNRLEELVANSAHVACSPTDPLHPNVFSLSYDYEGLHPNVASSSYDHEGMDF
ncbi:Agamous-like MADS-box protein [Actinidia chinensis var. chinensis]|uniref:Agamous-like MADS-box protein n=1 Tax=Actinidia chinensis var. chinensis TaxID=1590841 RepID=A0A2R6Q6S3_ACTCC|nr:Agamous-like MADS-box protein [Actinidia chinensis var. chinensis]